MGRQLIDRLSMLSTLQEAWNKVRQGSSPKSYGPDNIQLRHFNSSAKNHLAKIREQLKHGTFQFSQPRGIAIAKKADAELDDPQAWRGIIVSNICDRVVQRAILNITWSRLRDHICTPGSFGGIRPYGIRKSKKVKKSNLTSEIREDPKKCVKSAAEHIVGARLSGDLWIFETDIEKFYPSINKQALITQLMGVLKDSSLEILEPVSKPLYL